MGTTSEKYLTALHYQKQTRVRILVPHWFDDVVRLGVATVPTVPYEWPDPKVLHISPPSPKSRRLHKPPDDKLSLYKSVVLGTSIDGEIPGNLGKSPEHVDVWKGKRILLSVTLGLNPGRREAVVAGVKRCGGVVVDVRSVNDEVKKVEDVDVLITKFRAGPAYFKVNFSPLVPKIHLGQRHLLGSETHRGHRREPLLVVPRSNYSGHFAADRPASPLPSPK